MENKKISKETKTIIISSLLLIVGILFCFSMAMGIKALSYIIGIFLIGVGIISIVNSAMTKKTILNYSGLMGAGLIALGILFIINELALLIFYFVPWLLIVSSLVIIGDSIIKKKTQNNNAVFISELIVGIVVLALGLCLKFIPGFITFSSIMLGIVMILASIYLFVMVFTKNKNAVNE